MFDKIRWSLALRSKFTTIFLKKLLAWKLPLTHTIEQDCTNNLASNKCWDKVTCVNLLLTKVNISIFLANNLTKYSCHVESKRGFLASIWRIKVKPQCVLLKLWWSSILNCMCWCFSPSMKPKGDNPQKNSIYIPQ